MRIVEKLEHISKCICGMAELGINFDHIKRKTISVLHPTKSLDPDLLDDCDMAGPIAYCLMLGATLLLVRTK